MEEMQYRFSIWNERDEFIKNNGVSHQVAHNKFSDMRADEILSKTDMIRKEMEPTQLDVSDIPESVNWVDAGAVNPPLTQGTCRAAHTFAATTAMEGAYFI